jgi:hypothetical protein
MNDWMMREAGGARNTVPAPVIQLQLTCQRGSKKWPVVSTVGSMIANKTE